MQSDGWANLTLFCGCMFAGKSMSLLRAVDRLTRARREVMLFKPDIDNRYNGTGYVTSHTGLRIPATPIPVLEPTLILRLVRERSEIRHVAIDEAQFFDSQLTQVVFELLRAGVDVIAAGLDTDFRGEPFGCMDELWRIATYPHKLTAICQVCGGEAIRTQRLVNGAPASRSGELVEIGGEQTYEARCLGCHVVLD